MSLPMGSKGRVEHTDLFNEFTAFWFETKVGGVLHYETSLHFLVGEWETCRAGGDVVVLKGKLGKIHSPMSEKLRIAEVKKAVTTAIRAVEI